ncbi:MAG: bifunctional pyr operon transcriptional regulator/uracil phosphoribosyltransferase PyrR [Mariprofundaceae bacterium]
MPKIIFDTDKANAALDDMAKCMQQDDEVYLIGIHRGGAEVADALQHRLKKTDSTIYRGNLDISFYRDDLDTVGPNPEVRNSDLPFNVTDKHIWLVDDVLYTGRTIRAALGEIFDYGRPASIKLAVLVDRGGRQLPVAPNISGLKYEAESTQSVQLITDPAGWRIELKQVKK